MRPAHYRVEEGLHVTRIDHHRSGGQLLTAPEDRLSQAMTCILCQAMTCIVFATLPDSGQRGLIDDDVTDDMLGHRRVTASQQRLPVQPSGVTAVKVGVPAAG